MGLMGGQVCQYDKSACKLSGIYDIAVNLQSRNLEHTCMRGGSVSTHYGISRHIKWNDILLYVCQIIIEKIQELHSIHPPVAPVDVKV